MKRILLCMLAVAVAVMFVSGGAQAAKRRPVKKVEAVQPAPEPTPPPPPVEEPAPVKEKRHRVKASDFPEKGWHKGPYITANVGMMQLTNDKHSITGRKFNGTFDPMFGITFGWDIADWIGPLVQFNFATAKDDVGDVNNAVDTEDYGGFRYPTGTFPPETGARQYALDFFLGARATLPYFTRASWQPKVIKIIPFVKLGATGHAVVNTASNTLNMAGAFGGGPAIGLGCELFIWKGFFFAIDATEHLIFQQKIEKTINNVINLADNTTANRTFTIIKGGFAPQFTLNGMFGWHF